MTDTLLPTVVGVVALVGLATTVLLFARAASPWAPALAVARGTAQLAVISLVLSRCHPVARCSSALALTVMFSGRRRHGGPAPRTRSARMVVPVAVVDGGRDHSSPASMVFGTGARSSCQPAVRPRGRWHRDRQRDDDRQRRPGAASAKLVGRPVGRGRGLARPRRGSSPSDPAAGSACGERPRSSRRSTRRRRPAWSRCPARSSARSSAGVSRSRPAGSRSSSSPRSWPPAASPPSC